MEEDEFALARRQTVVDDHIHPHSVAPEPEMKDAWMIFATSPFLLLAINYHLVSTSRTNVHITTTTTTTQACLSLARGLNAKFFVPSLGLVSVRPWNCV